MYGIIFQVYVKRNKAILRGMDNETIKDLTDLTIEEIEAIRHVI